MGGDSWALTAGCMQTSACQAQPRADGEESGRTNSVRWRPRSQRAAGPGSLLKWSIPKIPKLMRPAGGPAGRLALRRLASAGVALERDRECSVRVDGRVRHDRHAAGG